MLKCVWRRSLNIPVEIMEPQIYPKDIIDCETEIVEKVKQINILQNEVSQLRQLLLNKKEKFIMDTVITKKYPERKLSNREISLYSRQMIVPGVGVHGQLSIKNSSVLIVGAGGLGCPALVYLSRGGIENFGIVDYDTVDINNIHRQTLFSLNDIGIPKVDAAKREILKINPYCNIKTYNCQLDSNNALEILKDYNIILDCTDNVATRYLLNDACVILKKPLVSGSALRLEGQLTVYNIRGGPCYRCLFSQPPPPETVTNCSDGGILGAVTGVIGSLQALEVFKIILNFSDLLSGRLLLFDANSSVFRNIKLRGKNPNCLICSQKPQINKLIDYEEFCGMKASDKDFALNVLNEKERISVEDYKTLIVDANKKHMLIDVRSPIEYEFCKMPNSINIPLKDIVEDKCLNDIKNEAQNGAEVILLCRRGNDSQLAVSHLKEKLKLLTTPKDVIGGLYAWQKKIDNTFPIY